MPVISRFFGIAIRMYYRDHAPPHFHARYGECEAVFSISDLAVIEGWFPPRARKLVLEWAVLHRRALMADWDFAREGRPLQPIPPLE